MTLAAWFLSLVLFVGGGGLPKPHAPTHSTMSRLRAAHAQQRMVAGSQADEEMVQLVVDDLLARFVQYADRLEPPIIHGVAVGVATKRCTMAQAVSSLAEMLGVPNPESPTAGSRPAVAVAQHTPPRQHTPPPQQRKQRPQSEVDAEMRLLEDSISTGFTLDGVLQARLSALRQLRRSWQEDVSRALANATRTLAQHGGPAIIADFLTQLSRQSRMKERLELRHVAPAIELVAASLSSLSATNNAKQIEGCIDAGQALHARFRPRITSLVNSGGSVDAMEYSRLAMEQFDVLASQLDHFARRADSAGQAAAKLCADIVGANGAATRRR
jgi:hypothetical protein